MRAPVNKIIPFSSVDGHGNRTAIFLQGCNFNCRYCHNPETINICVNCMECVDKCPEAALSVKDGKIHYDISKCCGCDTCIMVCPHGSSPRIREMTPDEVFSEVRKQMPYIRGITVSGGECTLYPEFLEELFTICKSNGLETLIDSNGGVDLTQYQNLLNVADGIMLDIKAYDEKDHICITGVTNTIVLNNARNLAKQGKLHEVRTVVVPELFDAAKTVKQIARMLAPWLNLRDIRYKLISYRPMGVREEFANYKVPTKKEMEMLAELIRSEGFQSIEII